MRALVVVMMLAGLCSPAGADPKMPDSTLRSFLATAAAVEGSCRDIKTSPAYLQMLGMMAKDVKRLQNSPSAMKAIMDERSKVAELIAEFGCGSFADAMNAKARSVGLSMPMFVRD